jgi:D-tyrosyl-tRNA(Tyr) deacylase
VFEKNDQKPQVDKMINKLLAYRIFADEQGKMNLSVADINGGVLMDRTIINK